ncbi:MAG: hypothetical protein FJ320_12225 [SAR202 cluster bacterium]|nr:hypothetical protein [SAR202 cluster bacterium]
MSYFFNPDLLRSTRGTGEPVESYVGEGYFNSGIFFGAIPGVPKLDTYSVKFPEPGSYVYVCGIHDYMKGTVEVEPEDSNDVQDQQQVLAEAEREGTPLLELANYNKQLAFAQSSADREQGPNNTGLWLVNAGLGPREAEVVDFFPKNLSITQGDTVVWNSVGYHAVVFDNSNLITPFYLPRNPPGGTPVVGVNARVTTSLPPKGAFDGSAFVSSGLIGPGIRWHGNRKDGQGFVMTFETPGTFTYVCPIRSQVGMYGSITVQPR